MTVATSRISGLLLAGTHSGCGKTTLTLGLMAALARRGLLVQPFKAGPDFIDPTLHRLVTGRISHNLDAWMCGEPFVRECFARHAASADVSLVEGVMGLFDGGEGSGGYLAKVLGLPVILVVDARSLAESAAALVKGFETLDPAVRLAGVILNRVGSDRHLELLRNAIAAHCQTEVIGHLPREASFSIPERHLGLHMGDEAPLGNEALARLAETVARHVDLERLVQLAATAEPRPVPEPRDIPTGTPVRIGIARDRAFCFYYEENLSRLVAAGAELVEFSPLSDAALPEGIQGLYLGGGYPELHAEALAANLSMRQAIRSWSEAGRPLYAECGGFMYLSRGIHDMEGRFHSMAAVYPVEARMQKGRASLGYRETTQKGMSPLGPAGMVLRGHEFHYSVIDPMPGHVARCYRLADGREEGYLFKKTLGGYLHLHWGARPEVARNFVRGCEES
ncbi:MAG: cobyrinate a,c-diamide synthase [Thermodesulfobacteriota bacterium]